jgi:phage terminase small subunit
MTLTAKQQAFVAEYLIDFNATQAAIRAGYSKKTAEVQGYENLRKPNIAEAIAAAQAARAERTQITADMVVQELAKIGFANMADYLSTGADPHIDLSTLTPDQAAAISEVWTEEVGGGDAPMILKRKIKLHSKLDALDKLARHLGIYEKDNRQAAAMPTFNLIIEGAGD